LDAAVASAFDLFVLIRALETRDVNAVTRRGDSTRGAFRSPHQVRRLDDYIEVASLDLSEIAPPIQKKMTKPHTFSLSWRTLYERADDGAVSSQSARPQPKTKRPRRQAA